MRTTLNGIFFKAMSEEMKWDLKEPKKGTKAHEEWKAGKKAALKLKDEELRRNEEYSRQRDADAQKPYKGSDGHWYQWVNDGRGGYTEVLSRSEEDRLDWDGGR